MSGGAASDWPDDSDIPKLELLEAAYDENMDKIEELLRRGVHCDSVDDDNVSALQIAAFMGNNLMVNFLIDRGADIEMASYIGMTPFLHACREGRLSVIETLLQRGADTDKTTYMGASALTLASAGGHIEVVKKLVSLKKKNTHPTQDAAFLICPTPMITAAFYKNPQICGFLSHRGFNIDERLDTLLQLTALSCAVLCNIPTVVSALLDLGADPQKATLKNRSAEELANLFGSVDIKNVFREHRRRVNRYDSRPRGDVRTMIKDNSFGEEDLLKIVDGAELANLLAFSISEGNLRAVKSLARRVHSLTSFENRSNLTPLQVAALLKRDECCFFLLNICSGQQHVHNALQFTAFDYLIKNGDQDNTLRAALHFSRPRKLEKTILNSSGSSSLSRMLPNMGKDWISKMSSQILNTEVDPIPRSTDQYDFLSARLMVMHAEGRNTKKFMLADQLLKTTRNLYPKKKITHDSQLDAVRNMAADSQRFLLTTFYDVYNASGRGEDDSASDKHRTHDEYDNAIFYSQKYGYPEKPRVRINPRDSINMHRRDGSDNSDRRMKPRSLPYFEAPTSQRTTPRMLKKTKEGSGMGAEERAESPTIRHHLSLSRMSSTPTLQVPTVLSSHHILSRSSGDCRKISGEQLNYRLMEELKQLKLYDVIQTFEANEIDAETFLDFKDEDYRNIRITDPMKIRELKRMQNTLRSFV